MQSDLIRLAPILFLSLRVSACAVFLSFLLGAPLGVWMGLTRLRGHRILLGLVHSGMAMPPVVVGLLVYLALSRSGPLGTWGWLYTPRAMILAQTILDLPLVIGVTRFAVASIPPDLYWQLRALGASRWQARRQIVREAQSGMILAVAIAFGRSLSEVGAVWLVGGNIEGQTRVLTTAIVLETGRGEFALAIWLAGALLMTAVCVNLIVVRCQGRGSA